MVGNHSAERRLQEKIAELMGARKREGATQAKVAAKAGIRASTLSEILSGKKLPGREVLERLTTALDATDHDTRELRFLAEDAREERRRTTDEQSAVYRLERWRPAHVDDVLPARHSPSALLAADRAVVDFTGRDEVITTVAAWRDTPEQFSVALVHGPGGQGKTRLAMRLAETSTDWTAARARHVSEPGHHHEPRPTRRRAGDCGRLVVVDYAERWPLAALFELANDLAAADRVRLLLVARAAGSWWRVLCHRLGVPFTSVALPPLAVTAGDRREGFAVARDRFAEMLGVPDPHRIKPPDNLADDRYSHALTLHMAALSAVEAHSRGAVAPADPAALSAYLLDREHAYWHDMPQTPVQTIAKMVYLAALTGPLSHARAVEALCRTGIAGADTAGPFLHQHALCYPPPATAGTVLEPLYPDLLSEDFLAMATPGHLGPTAFQDPEMSAWAVTAVEALLHPAGADPPEYAGAVVARLSEAAQRWPHLAARHLDPLLRRHPVLALTAGGATLAQLVELPAVSVETLAVIEPLLPTQPHIELDVAAATLSDRLTRERLLTTTTDADLVRLYGVNGERLAIAGRYEEALRQLSTAADIARTLDGQTTTLALILNSIAVTKMRTGHDEEAVGLVGEAVAILQATPARDEYVLGVCLMNLSAALCETGSWGEALAVADEATDLYRKLTATDPDRFESKLAAAMVNYALALLRNDRSADGLAAAEQAADLFRRFGPNNPGVHLPPYASALGQLGAQLLAAGRPLDAVAHVEESCRLLRQLSGTNPIGYRHELANALVNLAAARSDNARALDAAEEAVAIYRETAAHDPQAHLGGLIVALLQLGSRLTETGQRKTRHAAWSEALDLNERTPAALSPAQRPTLRLIAERLGAELLTQGIELANAGRVEEAAKLVDQAVRHLRAVPESAALAAALDYEGALCDHLGREDQAIRAGEELVAVRGGIEDLESLAARTLKRGAALRAMALTRESCELARALPGRTLARSLHRFGWVRYLCGLEQEDAVLALAEAARLYHPTEDEDALDDVDQMRTELLARFAWMTVSQAGPGPTGRGRDSALG